MLEDRQLTHRTISSALLPTLVLLAVLYFFRPWFHEPIMTLYRNPVILEFGLLTLTALAYAVKRSDEKFILDAENLSKLVVFFVVAGTLLPVTGVFASAFEMETLADQVETSAEDIQTLPDIDSERPRILPKSVAEEYADNSLQTPRFTLGEAEIAVDDGGKPFWSMPKMPDGGFNYFRLKQEGASFVDMTTQSKRIKYSDQNMKYGLGMGVFDNLFWKLKKEKFFVEYEDPITLEHEGETYIAVPYKEYGFHLKGPLAYTAPEFGGVALADSDGNIRFLEPEEAEQNEVLQDQRIYPFQLARKKVASMAYKDGFINAWFLHRDQLEVAEVPGMGNDQPFTVFTENGVEEFVATEPYGKARGVFQIWLIDGQTGDYKVYKLNRSSGLLGAERAAQYVKKANSRVNWGSSSTSSGFEPTEPLPVMLEDRLYWQIRVVPRDSTGVAFTSFVDAQSGDVYSAETDSDVISFLSGNTDIEGEQPQTPGEGNQTTESWMEVVIIENGEIKQRIPIEEDQEVELRKKE